MEDEREVMIVTVGNNSVTRMDEENGRNISEREVQKDEDWKDSTFGWCPCGIFD